jgi:hypothetical protein
VPALASAGFEMPGNSPGMIPWVANATTRRSCKSVSNTVRRLAFAEEKVALGVGTNGIGDRRSNGYDATGSAGTSCASTRVASSIVMSDGRTESVSTAASRSSASSACAFEGGDQSSVADIVIDKLSPRMNSKHRPPRVAPKDLNLARLSDVAGMSIGCG